MTDRECGSCTMCCKVMRIAEINKRQNEWCDHCDIGNGCLIYDSKPEECSTFVCGWLNAPESMREVGLTDDLRPDKSKVVLAMTESDELGHTLLAFVDPDRPEAWRVGAMGRFLMASSQVAPLIVVVGEERKLVLPDHFRQ